MMAAARDALLAGRVVGVPTDTVYGLAVHPDSRDGVVALYRLKGRQSDKAMAVLVADADQVSQVAELSPAARQLAGAHWPGPLTLVVKRAPGLGEWIGDAERGTVAVRVPDHPAALELLAATGPLVVTSANRSGAPPALDGREAEVEFGEAVAVYVEGECPGGQASTVVDLTTDSPRLLRPGPVEVRGAE